MSTENNSLTMDQLSETEQFPEVKENAIEAVKEQKQENAEIQAAADVKLNADGSPAKKRGRKPGQKNSFVNPYKKDDIPSQNIAPISSLQAATVVSATLEMMSVALISDEWKLTPIEKESNIAAWDAAFNHYGGVQISPPMALVMNHTAIILARAGQPKTVDKIGLFKAWIKTKVNFKFKRGKENAHSDSGSDIERKDDIRKEEGGKSKKAQ